MLKNLLITFVILASIAFSGCTRTVYVDKPEPYAVPVPCKTPDVHCHWQGNDTEVLVGVMKCLKDLKESNNVCKGK
jgi:hypothetical protein